MNTLMRKHAIRRYVVFRIKAMEFMDLSVLRSSLRSGQATVTPPLRPPIFFSDSIRTVVFSWFALFVDKNGMNVIELWIELFPKHAEEIRDAWSRMEPTWDAIREFRDRAGFHADKPKNFFRASDRIRREAAQLETAVAEFDALMKLTLKAKALELPDLEAELDSLLDELEQEHGVPYQREQFKAYLMIECRPESGVRSSKLATLPQSQLHP